MSGVSLERETPSLERDVHYDVHHDVHVGVWCDVCDCYPICGARYLKETGQGTYDVCQECYTHLVSWERNELTLNNDLQNPVPISTVPNALQKELHPNIQSPPVFSSIGISPTPIEIHEEIQSMSTSSDILPNMPDMELVKYRRSASLEEFINNKPDETNTAMKIWRWRIATFVESNPIRAIVVTAIVANSVVVGIYANGSIDDGVYDAMDLMFTLFFFTEISLKLFSFGCAIYFSDPW